MNSLCEVIGGKSQFLIAIPDPIKNAMNRHWCHINIMVYWPGDFHLLHSLRRDLGLHGRFPRL